MSKVVKYFQNFKFVNALYSYVVDRYRKFNCVIFVGETVVVNESNNSACIHEAFTPSLNYWPSRSLLQLYCAHPRSLHLVTSLDLCVGYFACLQNLMRIWCINIDIHSCCSPMFQLLCNGISIVALFVKVFNTGSRSTTSMPYWHTINHVEDRITKHYEGRSLNTLLRYTAFITFDCF